MPAGNHPNLAELRAYASLISKDKQLLTAVATQPSLDKLDYHGISLLALEQGTLSEEIKQQLSSRRAMMVANEAMKKIALSELFTAFSIAELKNHILFKGTALAYSAYPKPWLRPRSDSDCLIDFDELHAYELVFKDLGYEKIFAIKGKYVSYQATFFKALSEHTFVNIDLHWRINNRQVLADTFNVKDLLASSSPAPDLVDKVSIPHPVDSVLIAGVHRLGHHHQEERIIWLYDIDKLIAQFDDQDWAHLAQKASAKKIAAITLDALLLCKSLFGSHLPTDVTTALSEAAKKHEPSQFFLRRELPEWRYFLNDLKSLSRWRDRWGFLRETVFPDADYIKQKMQTSNLFLGYLKRGLRGIRRVTRSNKV